VRSSRKYYCIVKVPGRGSNNSASDVSDLVDMSLREDEQRLLPSHA
jgi:hypothetical protein